VTLIYWFFLSVVMKVCYFVNILLSSTMFDLTITSVNILITNSPLICTQVSEVLLLWRTNLITRQSLHGLQSWVTEGPHSRSGQLLVGTLDSFWPKCLVVHSSQTVYQVSSHKKDMLINKTHKLHGESPYIKWFPTTSVLKRSGTWFTSGITWHGG
jgi:hypothetical protein